MNSERKMKDVVLMFDKTLSELSKYTPEELDRYEKEWRRNKRGNNPTTTPTTTTTSNMNVGNEPMVCQEQRGQAQCGNEVMILQEAMPQPTPNGCVDMPDVANNFNYPHNAGGFSPMPRNSWVEIQYAGISDNYAQKINFALMMSTVKVNEMRMKANAEYEAKVRNAQLELWLMREKFMLKEAMKQQSNYSSEEGIVPVQGPINDKRIIELAKTFLTKRGAVKMLGTRGKTDFWLYDGDKGCHRIFNKDEIWLEFKSYVFNECDDIGMNLPETKVTNALGYASHNLPNMANSALQVLSESEVMFRNGVYNFMENSIREPYSVFSRFALQTCGITTDPGELVFDKLLADMFGDNKAAIKLSYQMLGAIIADVGLVKRIFLFQGVSGGGKTRLTEIFADIVGYDYVEDLNDISGITDTSVGNVANMKKMVIVRELSEKALSSKQVATLKGFSNGGRRERSEMFKILINANNSVFSNSSDLSLDRGLLNRILVLPFDRKMKNEDPQVAGYEDEYFDKEKPAIIWKALQAFKEYFIDKKFCHEFQLNAVVEKNTVDERQSLDIKECLSEYFEAYGEVNPSWTAESIATFIQGKIGSNVDKNDLGKKLVNVFDDKLDKGRRPIDGKMCYNLQLKKEDK